MRTLALLLVALLPAAALAPGKPRARDLGIPLEGTPGRHNAVTDIAGVEVGHATWLPLVNAHFD